MKDGHGVHNEYVPGTYRPLPNKDNDYLMDREAQKRGDTYSGVKGIAMQDASLQESMGPIVDRTKERLVSADSGIIKARRSCGKAAVGAAGRGRDAARRGPGAPQGPVGRGRAAAGPSRSSTPAATRSRPPPASRSVGLSMPRRPTLLRASCARATTAARRGTGSPCPIAPARAARVIALDGAAEAVTRRAAGRLWANARFYTCAGVAGTGTPDESAVLRDLDGSPVAARARC